MNSMNPVALHSRYRVFYAMGEKSTAQLKAQIDCARRVIVEIAAKRTAAPAMPGWFWFDVLVKLNTGAIWRTGYFDRTPPSPSQVAVRLVRSPESWSQLESEQ